MQNQAMKRKLKAREAIDLNAVGSLAECPITGKRDVFELKAGAFEEDVDYCDASTEAWVWSIGKEEGSGKVFAAFDGRYYQAQGFTCLWLR